MTILVAPARILLRVISGIRALADTFFTIIPFFAGKNRNSHELHRFVSSRSIRFICCEYLSLLAQCRSIVKSLKIPSIFDGWISPWWLYICTSKCTSIRALGYKRVYLPLWKVADTSFHTQGDELLTNVIALFSDKVTWKMWGYIFVNRTNMSILVKWVIFFSEDD